MLFVAAMTTIVAITAGAADGRLPIVPLLAEDGTATTTATLVRPGRWAVIYVPTECGGCGSLLRLIVRDEHPGMPARLAIVVGGATAESVRVAKGQFSDLTDASWLADPAAGLAGSLQLGTTPAVVGMNGDAIEWTITGVLAASPDIRSVLERWLEP